MGTPAGLAFSDTSGILTDRYLVTNPGEWVVFLVYTTVLQLQLFRGNQEIGLIESRRCLNFFFSNIILIIIVF